jgi:predicted DNA-binding transcriptional regulator AlpA
MTEFLSSSSTSSRRELAPVLLVTAKVAAEMCGKSLRTWRAWDAAGRIPRPVKIGRSTLWRVDELRAWVADACPRREVWESRPKQPKAP